MEQLKAVLVHRGARDGYQVGRALAERGLLEALITDLHWPAETAFARQIESRIPTRFAKALRTRWSDPQTTAKVSTCWISGLSSLGISKLRNVPFDWQRRAIRWSDTCLGTRAGKLATRRGAAILSYSYYGQSAFANYAGDGPRILFQLHPHPERVRQILERERDLHPECSESLNKEWELSLPPEDFERLTAESRMADHWIAASGFTSETLIESGVPAERIHVTPYGADLERFRPCPKRRAQRGEGRLRLLFVGTINQRKGIKYLLDAVEMIHSPLVELVVCGRVVDDLPAFKNFHGSLEVWPSVSSERLVEAYQTSDIFVFPSLAEGFGHVLLEAMACGLPVVSTNRTAARELVREGVDGFLVAPGSSVELASRLELFLKDRTLAARMGAAARLRAEEFTWPRFRSSIGEIVGGILNQSREKACAFHV